MFLWDQREERMERMLGGVQVPILQELVFPGGSGR